MQIRIILLFMALMSYSCKTIEINAWKDSMISCDAYLVTKIKFGADGIYPGVSEDTVSVMYITIIQSKSNYKIEGPDYCLLSVIDENNDTIARDAINGLPRPGRSRTYWAYSDKKWKARPDLDKIHISIPPYCDNLNMKPKK